MKFLFNLSEEDREKILTEVNPGDGIIGMTEAEPTEEVEGSSPPLSLE